MIVTSEAIAASEVIVTSEVNVTSARRHAMRAKRRLASQKRRRCDCAASVRGTGSPTP